MEKVFHFDALREPYQADAAVVACFDHRFRLALPKYLKRNGILATDSIIVAGGAKSLASPANETDREFALGQLRTSVRLHRTPRVILSVHSDCGAYGGLDGAFRGDVRAEAQHHEEELRRASACVAAAIPEIEIQALFIDFEGIWNVNLSAGCP